MSMKMTWVAVIVLILGSSVAVAQPPSGKKENGDQAEPNDLKAYEAQVQTLAFLAQKQQQTARYEDIEIMCRLLSSKLEQLYPSRARDWRPFRLDTNGLPDRQQGNLDLLSPGSAPNPAQSSRYFGLNSMAGPASQVPSPSGTTYWPGIMGSVGGEMSHPLDVEGSYLPGYGIVYTVTLPPRQRKPKTESTKPQPKPLSDWERIRKQLHGETDPDEGRQVPAQPQEISLTDVILKTLFENGHHLAPAQPDEKLTVAITFRPAEQQGIQVTATRSAGDPFASGTRTLTGDKFGIISSSGSSVVGGPITVTTTKPPSSAHDYLLLGDLHLRQGQANDALNAYRRALNELSSEASDNNALGQLRELHQKLAQAYLSLGDVENVAEGIR